MSRTFVYARVSTFGQTTENQLGEIEAAGFTIARPRIVTETISGSVAARERPQFARLLDRLEPGDVLVVTKLDRLGRDAIDVAQTIKALAEIPVRVHCLALAGTDLTSSTGSLTMTVLNAVAQFERDLLLERTHAGIARARSQGKRIGRPPVVSPELEAKIFVALDAGASVASIARTHGISRGTVAKVRDRARGGPELCFGC